MDGVVNAALQTHAPLDFALQGGDYGFGPFGSDKTVRGKHPWTSELPLIVLPGNHENWDTVAEMAGVVSDDNFYVAKRPEIVERDGVSMLLLPGADSIDKDGRRAYPPWQSWWPQEEVLDSHVEEAMALLEEANGVDIIVTHCAPLAVVGAMGLKGPKIQPDRVPSSVALNTLYYSLAYDSNYPLPWMWVFGHYHLPQHLSAMIPNGYMYGAPIISRRWFADVTGFAVIDTEEETLTVVSRNNVDGRSFLKGEYTREEVIPLPPRIINRGYNE